MCVVVTILNDPAVVVMKYVTEPAENLYPLRIMNAARRQEKTTNITYHVD
jgi:hypothetical protein